MAGLEVKNFQNPDETRPFKDKGQAEIVSLGDGTIGGATIGRLTLEPGWRWSEHVKPIAGTESCEAPHMAYVVSGRMKIVMDDGTEAEVGPGDAAVIPPGHDAWTLGDEACVMVDFGGMENYAKQS